MASDGGVELPAVSVRVGGAAGRGLSGAMPGGDDEDNDGDVRPLSERSRCEACSSWYHTLSDGERRDVSRIGIACGLLLAVTIAAVCIAVLRGGGAAPAAMPQFVPHDSDLGITNKTLLLISFDGFRWDYFGRTPTPNIDKMMREGVRADAMQPAFPSKTFPNHYSIVTGLYPESHGIVLNRFWDPVFDATFTLRNGAPLEGRWWGGEPLWVTAGKAGLRSGCVFWPGSEAEIKGRRPTYYLPYDHNMQYDARVDRVVEWLLLPPAQRPSFLTLYVDAVDTAGHIFGPATPECDSAVRDVDRVIGYLYERFEAHGMTEHVDVVLVSDHGMTRVSPSRTIYLADYIDESWVRVIDYFPVLMIDPVPPRTAAEVLGKLRGAHPNLTVWAKEDVPERLNYRHNRRIMPVVGLADLGWTVVGHHGAGGDADDGGAHGYDNAEADMRAIFVARGPSFKAGLRVPMFANTEVYELVCNVMGMPPAPNNGSRAATADWLR